MPNKLYVGDIVHLNSGSPDLTVVSFTEKNVTVKWEETEDTFPLPCVHAARILPE